MIETILNKTLSLDPKASTFLNKLEGNCLELKIKVFHIHKRFFVHFTQNLVQISSIHENPPNVIVQGPIHAFLNYAITKDSHQSADLGLSFEGDTEILKTIQEWFLTLDIDWEEPLSYWTGDVIAHQIMKSIHYAKKRQNELLKSTRDSVSEYLKEESLLFPPRVEIEKFLNEVDIVRAGVDRLEAKIEQLQADLKGEQFK